MTGERWKRIEQLFESALSLPADQRPVYLDGECNGDQDLRLEVQAMLSAGGDFGGAVQSAIARQATGLAASGEAMIGKRLGSWRLARVLGHGGTGTVFLAVRDDQAFHKQAAIKLIKRGMETAQVLGHFRRERQILARLDHPYIARLLDGGSTDDGVPYFVMEYVDGTPITTYCESHQLRVADRLRLFLNVCAAVQFAHQNLIVHRDLKPGNIFITRDGTPKLLDFGLAKFLQPDPEMEQTVTTTRMLTPDYASPEQVRGEPVTTSTDVYSLGVVLYEVLTGRRPFETRGGSWPELERTICQTEPTSPATNAPELRGDIENIVLKALRKDPVRRYASMDQFAEDIRRHLAGLPVLARKDTMIYRTGKFLRRNRWPVAAGAVAVAGLVLAAGIALVQARRAQRQFDSVRSLAMTMLIDVNEKFRVLPGSVDGRKLMVEKGLEYLGQISREARQDPSILWDLARGYEKIASLQASPDFAEPNLGDFQNGLRNYQQALGLTQKVEAMRGRDDESLLLLCRIHVAIGGIHPSPGDADRHLHEGLRLIGELGPAVSKRIWEPDGPPIREYLRDLAFAFLGMRVLESDPPAALDYFRKTWPQFRESLSIYALARMGDLEGSVASSLGYEQGQRELASSFQAEDIRKRIVRGSTAIALLSGAGQAGNPFEMNLGDRAQAIAMCRRSLALIDLSLQRDPSDLFAQSMKLAALSMMAGALSANDPAESVKIYSSVLSSKIYPGMYPDFIPPARWRISYPLRRLGRRHEALQHALQSLNELPPMTNPMFSHAAGAPEAHLAVADALLDLGRRETALDEYKIATTLAEKRASDLPKNMAARAELAGIYGQFGRYYEVAKEWKSAREWFGKAHGLWRNWTKAGGVSNVFVVRSEREMEHALARCDAAAKSKLRSER